MFTGIVEERGRVRSLTAGRLEVACSTVTHGSPVGASVAVSGTCLTVVARSDEHLAFDLSSETLARTPLGTLGPGDEVNLERPLSLAARLGGHLVQGHVDGTGTVTGLEPGDDGGALLTVALPEPLSRFVVEKGSITIDGVSLTVAAVHDEGVSFALIPHTLAATTLGDRRPGDAVAVEVDMIARYVERLLAGRT